MAHQQLERGSMKMMQNEGLKGGKGETEASRGYGSRDICDHTNKEIHDKHISVGCQQAMSRTMKIISWNSRELGNPWAVRAVKKLLSFESPDIIFLMETKHDCKVIFLKNIVELSHLFLVGCEGNGRNKASGLILLWTDFVGVEIISWSLNHI